MSTTSLAVAAASHVHRILDVIRVFASAMKGERWEQWAEEGTLAGNPAV